MLVEGEWAKFNQDNKQRSVKTLRGTVVRKVLTRMRSSCVDVQVVAGGGPHQRLDVASSARGPH